MMCYIGLISPPVIITAFLSVVAERLRHGVPAGLEDRHDDSLPAINNNNHITITSNTNIIKILVLLHNISKSLIF